MTKLTSHLLDATNGDHAANVDVSLYRLEAEQSRIVVAKATTNAQGRFELILEDDDHNRQYELVIEAALYFNPTEPTNPVKQIVIRFTLEKGKAAQHIPVILSPNSYSVWWSN